MFERIIQYLIVTFGANDQATDESLIINQLWNDHPESIAFLPPDFNVSMLQTPEWATNPVMQSFVYHFIGPASRIWIAVAGSEAIHPSCHFLTTVNRSN